MTKMQIIAKAVLSALGLHIAIGAPRFVRWHVKKTLELSPENRDNAPVP